MESIDPLSDRRWGRILEGIRVGDPQSTGDDTNYSLSENCRNLYVPSSPVRASDNE